MLWWINFSLEYFLTNKTQKMDLNALVSEKNWTIFFAMTRYSLLYLFLLYCIVNRNFVFCETTKGAINFRKLSYRLSGTLRDTWATTLLYSFHLTFWVKNNFVVVVRIFQHSYEKLDLKVSFSRKPVSYTHLTLPTTPYV